MQNCKKKFLIFCVIGMPIIVFLFYVHFPWVILPIDSSPYTVTFVKHGYPCLQKISMRHYINDLPINDYVLDLKIELRNQHQNRYNMPRLDEGRVEINIELEDGVIYGNNNILKINYAEANELFRNGLLIFLKTDFTSSAYVGDFICYDQYVYLISGEKRIIYFEAAGSSVWTLVTDAPPLKRVTLKEAEYSPIYYGWKENKWVVNPAETM